MKKHILYIAIATTVFKLIFNKIDILYLFIGVSLAYFAGMLPWVCFEFITNKFQKKGPSIEKFMRYSQTPEYRKKLTLANEIFLTLPQLPTDQELNKSEVRDLKITINPSKADTKKYVVNIKNTGNATYKNINLELRKILLWAESFGIDATHMPADMEYAEGGYVKLEKLNPKDTISIEVAGYNTHDKYDHKRIRYAKISFDLDTAKTNKDIQHWCEIIVNLPGATRE